MGLVPSCKPGLEAGLHLGLRQRPILVGIEGGKERLGGPAAVRSLRSQARECDR